MKRTFIACIALFVFFIPLSHAAADTTWRQIPGIEDSDIREVTVADGEVYIASQKVLYKSGDSGKNWKAIFSVRGEGNIINFAAVFKGDIFVCTNNGLFRRIDGETGWKRIFKGVGAEENIIWHIAPSEDGIIYIGTGGGLFISYDKGATWQKELNAGSNLDVRWISFWRDYIIIASQKGVYKGKGHNWERIFVTNTEEVEYDYSITDEQEAASKAVNSIFVKADMIFLATDEGVFISNDGGVSWDKSTSAGLVSDKIYRILISESGEIFAAGDKGIFIFDENNKEWKALYKGISAYNVRSIAEDNKGSIWVATAKGLYRLGNKSENGSDCIAVSGGKEQDILELFSKEPGIKEIQEAAVEYAEVHPDKIRQWRSSASKKALLPDLSVGLDRYVTDYWHWDAGANPDVLVKGDDAVSWDITLSWRLGDLIWNDDQTSIDVRSKLMVQLRDDILSQTTRTYFERRRLLLDMHFTSSSDLRSKMEKELRIQELTADLDALTGGYFSENICD